MTVTQPREKGRGLRALWSSERGGAAVYLGLATLFFFLPLTGVAISLTQLYTLNTELQQAADAAALAAAWELDGTDAGCVAAEAAALTAVQNYQSFATDESGAEAELSSVTFLTALPPAPLTQEERLGATGRYGDYIAAKCGDTRYVRVVTTRRELLSLPIRAWLAGFNLTDDTFARLNTSSAAVAAHVTVACKTMPLMMCNPIEIIPGQNCGDPSLLNDPDTNIDLSDQSLSNFFKKNPQWHRRMFRIKWIGPNAQAAPGVFGLLEPFFSDKNAVPGIVEEFAIEDPPICVNIDSPMVDVKTGQAQAIVNGLNTRMDIYRSNANKYKNNPGYRPGPNVTKGLLSKADGGQGGKCDPKDRCNDPTSPNYGKCSKLFRDECFKTDGVSGGCFITAEDSTNPQFDARIGDGIWDVDEYFKINHPQLHAELFTDGICTADEPLCTNNGWPDLDGLLTEIRDSVPSEKYKDNAPVSVNKPPSRYSVYNWELDNHVDDGLGPTTMIPGEDTQMASVNVPLEEGKRPMAGTQCSNAGAASRERRNVFIAVVNCCAQMDALSSGQRVVRVNEFLEAFMTEPADATAAGGFNEELGAIYVEAIRVLKAGDSNQVVLRDYVQLY